MSFYVVNNDRFCGTHNGVAVLDTNDGVIEWIKDYELCNYICRGIKIIGANAKLNDTMKIIEGVIIYEGYNNFVERLQNDGYSRSEIKEQ